MDKLAVRKSIKRLLEPLLEIKRYIQFGPRHKIIVDKDSIFIHNGALPLVRPMTRISIRGNSTFTMEEGGAIKPGATIAIRNSRVRIGKNSYFNVNLQMMQRNGEILVGDDCAIGPDVVLRGWDGHGIDSRPIIIENHVWIGMRAIILKGAHIGEGCVVGAGAVVTGKKYPPHSLIAGNPAVVVRKMIDDWV